MSRILSPIKYAGGKTYLAKKICDQLKTSLTSVRDGIYVEGFSGGLSVLLNLDLDCKKYAFDLDEELIRVWGVIQKYPKDLQKSLRLSGFQYSQENFKKRFIDLEYERQLFNRGGGIIDLIKHASNYIFINRCSRSANMKDFGTSTRLRGGQNEYKNAYENAVYNLPITAQRLKNVHFEAGDYIQLMEKYGLDKNPSVVSYIDPPYVQSARTSKNVYKYEMPTYYHPSKTSHQSLWYFTNYCAGTHYLSGYECDEYKHWSEIYKGEIVFQREIANHACQKKIKSRRREILWRVAGV